VSVPVIWASWIFRKKIIIHQQDIRPTLSNKLTSWCASRITISFKKSLQDYPKEKTEYIGNPVRNSLTKGNAEAAKGKFHLNSDLPTLLITGGSSGADSLNKWVWDNINQISPKANIIHLTGNNKSKPEIKLENYHQIEFLGGDMFHVLVASDLVISRAGISTLTELAYLAKPSIIIPMPGTHQEDNAFYILDEHAALVYRQDQLDVHLIQKVQELLQNKDEREKLSKNIRELMKQGARERMIEIIQAYGFK
tara:strand:- start:616 stop:1371 length:756 start_codon:yes stop_codon:yes gene_type:complete